ncbi:MAG: hypothetical protein J0L92_16090 [Deltaproteobacteria bacterium]|nr:hypothetical protein [Deltaproteobacteria bacterium]
MAVRTLCRVLGLIALVICASTSERARACSCIAPRMARVHVPRDGALEVPTDATIRVFLTHTSPSLRAQLGTEYQLRDARGALVPFDATVVSTRLDLHPRVALRANETYVLEQLFVFGPDGTRLDDEARRVAPPGTLRGAFFPVSRFVTSAGPSSQRAVALQVDEASLSFPRGGGDCGPGAGMAIELAQTLAGPHDLLELRVRAAGGRELAVSTRPAQETMLYAGDLLCTPDPVALPPGQSVTYRVVMLDAAGRELGATPWARASERAPRRRARPVIAAGLPPGWAVTSIVSSALAITTQGPAGCEHGLEERGRLELVATGAPSSYADRSELALEGSRVWAFYLSPPEGTSRTVRAISVAPDASPLTASLRETTIEGVPEAVLRSGPHTIVLARLYTPAAVTTATLSSLALGGSGALATTWQIPFDASAGRYRMALGRSARGTDELAIVYGRRPPGQYSESLSFVFVDPRDGRETGPALHTAHGLDTNAEGASIAHVGGRFVVVWPSGAGLTGRGPLRATTVSSAGMGTIVDLPIDSYSPPDLVSAGDVLGLATASRDGRVELSVIGSDGALVRGPFALSRGVGGRDNRVPRIAWDGQRFAVLWETHPAAGAYVVVVDGAGHVSPPLRIDRDEVHASGLGLVATPTGFVATYTGGYGEHGMAVSLQCRTQAASGAPVAITPAP